MEGLYIFLIVLGLFVGFVILVMTISMKVNANQLRSDKCKKDGEKWLRLMKIYYKHNTGEAIKDGLASPEACIIAARELEKEYSTNPEIPLAWRDKELVELIDSQPKITVPQVDNVKDNDFNINGAIIGGIIGGTTGAYIGSHIKKKNKD